VTGEASGKTTDAGSRLEKLLDQGKFAVTAELGPPKSADAEVVRRKAKLLAPVVDAVNITDNQTAIVRMSSVAAAKIALDNGCEPVMQMTCRDRNVLAIQSDILGAYALGICNILCLTGDHQRLGNHPTSKNVFDVDSIQLVQIVARMREQGVFANDEPIRSSRRAPVIGPKMFVGAAASPLADPVGFRIPRLAKKVAAGARFVQTQLIYDVQGFESYMREVVQRKLHERAAVLAGVMPAKGARALEYMDANLAGVRVPGALIERMQRAEQAARDSVAGSGDEAEAARKKAVREAARAEGVRIAVELIERLRRVEGVRGVHIMAVEWEEAVPEIVERAGLR
jgi:methylenetetrahydrofolate reductase (NADPH)